MKVLVTGATGLIGRALLPALIERGHRVHAIHRRQQAARDDVLWRRINQLGDLTAADFDGIDVVVHLAAHVPQMGPKTIEQQQMYFAVNCDQTLDLAQVAAAAGVRHFIFISSVKAVGERELTHPLRETDQEHPEDSYGRSKLCAEQALAAVLPLVVTVLRFPLVYGPGVKANFAQLALAVERGWPLPLGRALARRSLLGVDNAASAIIAVLEAKPTTHRTYHVADRETPSVRELIEYIARAYGRRARLLNLPLVLLRLGAWLTGRGDTLARLIEPLRVDQTRIQQELGWRAPVSLQEGLLLWRTSEAQIPLTAQVSNTLRPHQ